jgi:hypothetical protein
VHTLTAAHHPNDLAFRQKRHSMIRKDMLKWSPKEAEEGFFYAASQPAPDGTKEMSQRVMGELATMAATKQLPDRVKSILDSTGGGTAGGSALVRQDLEPSAR